MCTDTRREIGRRLTDGMPVTADDTDKLLSNELTSVTTNDTSIYNTQTQTQVSCRATILLPEIIVML